MQDMFVYVIVGVAAFYLVRTFWSALAGGKSGCNSCGSNCAAQKPGVSRRTPQAQQLVQIDLGNLNGKR